MIVVAIIGILAAVAIPSFQSYLMRAKAAEAPGFLAEIQQRQESYRAEFGQYAAVSNPSSLGIEAYNPAGSPPAAGNPVAWPIVAAWKQLGAHPDGYVRFQYATVAGNPGEVPAWGGGLGYGAVADFWFVSQARADLDGDGTPLIMESYSESSAIYVDAPGGWE